MKRPRHRRALAAMVWAFAWLSSDAAAQNVQILDQRLDSDRHGYSVVRVWGTHHEMGFAMGAAFAQDIADGVAEVRAYAGSNLDLLRAGVATTVWQPAEIEDELAGMVAGVKSVLPAATMDVLDLKVVNTYGDWAYVSGCRSHSCWGSFVSAPVQTLSTRRLDYSTPFDAMLHHVLCAWDPNDGSPRWVNLAWPGFVTVITGVNAHGTVASLHDFGPGAASSTGLLPRSVAARYILTGMGTAPVDEHLTWAQQLLASHQVATSSFINYFVPGGAGGVFTCTMGGPCGQLRTPQLDYFGGDVLITTNDQTDGHSVPAGGEFMHDYYATGGPKDLASHFELMGMSGLHLASVEVRGVDDMTIWAHGRGRTDRIEVEWTALYASSGAGASSGVGGSGVGTGGTGAHGAGTSGPDPNPAGDDAEDSRAGEDCGCRSVGRRTSLASAAWLAILVVLARTRRRQAPRPRSSAQLSCNRAGCGARRPRGSSAATPRGWCSRHRRRHRGDRPAA